MRSRCGEAGVLFEIRRGTEASTKRQRAILTMPPNMSAHALATLSSWIYVNLGTRPFDPIAAAAEEALRQEQADVEPPNTAWTCRELRYGVGRAVRKEFLAGVEAICESEAIGCQSHVERGRLALLIVVTISGPEYAVDSAVARMRRWQSRFRVVPDGPG
jgi:hypothetical protein